MYKIIPLLFNQWPEQGDQHFEEGIFNRIFLKYSVYCRIYAYLDLNE